MRVLGSGLVGRPTSPPGLALRPLYGPPKLVLDSTFALAPPVQPDANYYWPPVATPSRPRESLGSAAARWRRRAKVWTPRVLPDGTFAMSPAQEVANALTMLIPFAAALQACQLPVGAGAHIVSAAILLHFPFSFVYHLNCARFTERHPVVGNAWCKGDLIAIHLAGGVMSLGTSGVELSPPAPVLLVLVLPLLGDGGCSADRELWSPSACFTHATVAAVCRCCHLCPRAAVVPPALCSALPFPRARALVPVGLLVCWSAIAAIAAAAAAPICARCRCTSCPQLPGASRTPRAPSTGAG
jgi:hypothetical protein